MESGDDEMEMTVGELQSWIQEEVENQDLVKLRRTQLAQMQNLVQRKEKQALCTRTLFNTACESVVTANWAWSTETQTLKMKEWASKASLRLMMGTLTETTTPWPQTELLLPIRLLEKSQLQTVTQKITMTWQMTWRACHPLQL